MSVVHWLGIPVAVCLLLQSNVQAQARRQGRGAANQGQAPANSSSAIGRLSQVRNTKQPVQLANPTHNRRSPLSTFEGSRFRGISTIPDQLRAMLHLRDRPPTRFEFQLPGATPVQNQLQEQNSLGVRSSLAQRATFRTGRNPYRKDDSGEAVGDYERILRNVDPTKVSVDPNRPDDGRFQDSIQKRLDEKADQYFDESIAAFRKGQFIRSKDYLQLVKDVQPDRTRAYLAETMVATRKGDFAQASGSLLRAFEVAKSLDDLTLDLSRFYPNREDLRRITEQLNLFTQRNNDNPISHTLLSFYSWLNGDIGTAINSAATAEKLSVPPANTPVKKFREMLVDKRAATTKKAD